MSKNLHFEGVEIEIFQSLNKDLTSKTKKKFSIETFEFSKSKKLYYEVNDLRFLQIDGAGEALLRNISYVSMHARQAKLVQIEKIERE